MNPGLIANTVQDGIRPLWVYPLSNHYVPNVTVDLESFNNFKNTDFHKSQGVGVLTFHRIRGSLTRIQDFHIWTDAKPKGITKVDTFDKLRQDLVYQPWEERDESCWEFGFTCLFT